MKKALAVAAVAAFVLVPMASALGNGFSLPKPKDSTIVVPTSIAGLRAGMSQAKGIAAWGTGKGECSDYGTAPYLHTDCNYGDFNSAVTGSAVVRYFKGRLASVEVNSARVGTGDPNFKAGSALLKMKTSTGFGIGAKYASVKKAYPKGKLEGTPSDERFIYKVKGKGKAYFTFTFWGKNQKAFILSLSDGVYHP